MEGGMEYLFVAQKQTSIWTLFFSFSLSEFEWYLKLLKKYKKLGFPKQNAHLIDTGRKAHKTNDDKSRSGRKETRATANIQ